MSEASVSTIPMDPKRSQELFLFTTPLVGDFVAKATGRSLMLPINRLGEEDLDLTGYQAGLAALGISPYKIRFDNEKGFLEFMENYVYEQYREGALEVSEEQLLVCNCGAVEILNEATAKIEKRTNGKTFRILPYGKIACKKCKSAATLLTTPCLMRLPKEQSVGVVDVQPHPYRGCVLDHLSIYFGCKHLISRQRETAMKVNLQGTEFHLDNDYIWLHYGRYLRTIGENPDVIVASNHSLRKGAIYAAFMAECGDEPINLVVTPYVDLTKQLGDCSVKALSAKYPPSVLRAFMLIHLNWRVQNSKGDLTWLRWLARVVNEIDVRAGEDSLIAGITNKIKGHNLKTGLVDLKRGKELSSGQNLSLSLIKS